MSAASRDPDVTQPPGFVGSIQLLPWRAQLGAAALVLATGLVPFARMSSSLGALGLFAVALAASVPLGWSGLSARKAELVDAAERARADAELEELRGAVEAARARGAAIDRMLIKRGYTSARVRRWIARDACAASPKRQP